MPFSLPTIFESDEQSDSDAKEGNDNRKKDGKSQASSVLAGISDKMEKGRALTPSEEELVTTLKQHFARRDSMVRANCLCTQMCFALLLIILDLYFFWGGSSTGIAAVALICIPFMCSAALMNVPLWLSIFLLIYYGWSFVAGQFTVSWVRT